MTQQRRPSGWRYFAGLVAVTVLAGLLNRASSAFQVAPGVALVFPSTGIVVAGALLLGWPAVFLTFAALAATAWGVATTPAAALYFGALGAAQGAIPLVVGLRESGPTRNRIIRFFLWAVCANTFLSMLLGIPAAVHLAPAQETPATIAMMAASWFVGDALAVVLIAVPMILAVRPRLLLDRTDRGLFGAFLRRDPVLAGLTLGLVIVVVAMDVLIPTGIVSCHWIAGFFLPLILIAAVAGGVGGGLLANAIAGIVYLGEVIRLVHPETNIDLFRTVFSNYTNMSMFTVVAIVAGLYSGRVRVLVSTLENQRAALQKNFERVVTALAAAIEAKDPTTRGHVQRVARHAVAVGRELGVAGADLEILRYAAILHDVGKIGVPEQVLNKQEPLTPEERARMEAHVEAGVEILQNVDILAPAIPIIRYHQERWDGDRSARYPAYFGLKGEAIPLASRIIAVVDAYDAMTNDRPYREAMSHEEAVAELLREAGGQFDPAIVEAFIAVLDRERIEDSSSRWPIVEDL